MASYNGKVEFQENFKNKDREQMAKPKKIDLEKLLGQAAKGEVAIKDVLKQVALEHLNTISMMNNMVARALMSVKVQRAYNDYSKDLKKGHLDSHIQEQSAKITRLTRGDIEKIVRQKTSSYSTIETARQAVKDAKKASEGLTVEDKISFIKSVQAILPDAGREFYNTVILNGLDAEAHVRTFEGMTDEEQAQILLDRSKTLPVDAVVDALYEVAQKTTPQALKTALLSVFENVSQSDVRDIALGGINVAEDALKTIKKHDRIGVKNEKQAAEFGQSLSRLFNAAVEGAVKAGITPDTDLKAAFANSKTANDNKKPAAPKKKKGNDGLNF
jgi:hypothetical protein